MILHLSLPGGKKHVIFKLALISRLVQVCTTWYNQDAMRQANTEKSHESGPSMHGSCSTFCKHKSSLALSLMTFCSVACAACTAMSSPGRFRLAVLLNLRNRLNCSFWSLVCAAEADGCLPNTSASGLAHHVRRAAQSFVVPAWSWHDAGNTFKSEQHAMTKTMGFCYTAEAIRGIMSSLLWPCLWASGVSACLASCKEASHRDCSSNSFVMLMGLNILASRYG